jgi:UDP-N-acetylmuramate: L-alanyl-gamma-D-glutamyl-meso-diaminopimelate ligase
MHIHILGICGTFMGGVAALAKAAGHRVTGSDRNVYPPMSNQLRLLGIDIVNGYDPDQLDPGPDCVVVGNAMSRGNATVEAMLDRRIPYYSGPQWLSEHVLQERHVMAVAGTHGKTTTASMLAWILEDAGLAPGFLIGGIPANFGESARIGASNFFVVEADEYDTAFFDKRAKFVHFRPQTLVINNIEYDHADIYPDVESILWQFHQLLRTVPSSGRIVRKADDRHLDELIRKGCWTPVETFSVHGDAAWRGRFVDSGERRIEVTGPTNEVAEVQWKLGGSHNLENAIAAIAAARSAGVALTRAIDAMSRFEGVKRRMERTATVADIAIYDDFAHHPTAIRSTLSGLKKRYPGQRVVVALEPRSNTMKLGVHNATLTTALDDADLVFVYRPDDMDDDFDRALASAGPRLQTYCSYDSLVEAMSASLLAGDQVVFMSNGGFGAARQKLTMALQQRRAL